ncbi:MAG: hypothetical protein J5644_06800 [Bacteroidales bacterium]|nr:hypothetical protein [Bacteroidales bacterium]
MPRLGIITIFWQKAGLLTGLLFYLLFFAHAQDVADSAEHVVTAKEWNFNLELNTAGGGLWFQKGWTPDYYNKHFFEVGGVYNRHPKAVRVKSSLYGGSTSFCYGKLCDLFLLRAGYGYQRTLHHKPYWGGVSIRYTLSAGLSLGLVFPTYLRVVDDYGYVSVQKYDPETIDASDILGHAPFWTNIAHISYPRPGFYGKTGFLFDFSKKDQAIHALEIGVCLDMIFPFVQQMAYNKAKPFYLAGYLSYNVGKKKRSFE